MAFDNVKSVVIDIVDNWGLTNGVGVRSIEFTNDGVVIPLDYTDTVCYATSSHASYPPRDAFNTTQPKTGVQGNGEWICTSYYQAVRLICVFNIAIDFNGITINNIHHSGTNTTNGIKNIKIYTSTDTITSTVYNSVITNSDLIFTGEIPIHVSSDVIDDYIVPLTTYGTVIFLPSEGTYPPDTEITFSGTNPVADIYYTVDGADPSIMTSFSDLTTKSYAIGQENPLYLGAAFNNILNSEHPSNAWYAYDGAYVATGWTGQDFTSISGTIINEYRVYPNVSSRAYDPKNWTFEGSINGVSWDVLDTQIDQVFDNLIWSTYSFSNIVKYNYYRLNVSVNNGSTILLIQEIEMGYVGMAADLYSTPLVLNTDPLSIRAILISPGMLPSGEVTATYTYADPIFKYSGYVQADGLPVRRNVRLHNRTTGDLIVEGYSDAGTGYFELDTYIDVVCYAIFIPNIDDDYNMMVRDKINLVNVGY